MMKLCDEKSRLPLNRIQPHRYPTMNSKRSIIRAALSCRFSLFAALGILSVVPSAAQDPATGALRGFVSNR